MTIAIPTDRPLISVYFCGGTGFNLGSRVYDSMKNNPAIKCYFLDTSTSNNKEINTQENTMILGSGQGSGSSRGENAKSIRDRIPSVLKEFRPGVFNILVGSASGGSGSTIMNEMHRELSIRELNSVSVMTGTRSSMTNIRNMHNTFQSYALVTKNYKRPSLVNLRIQEPGESRDRVDALVLNNLTLLTLLFSGKDDKLDITDLSHLINYPKVTGFAPAVASLELFINTVEIEKNETIYAVGTIARVGAVTDITPAPQYQPVGFIPSESDLMDVFSDIDVLHWAVVGNSFDGLMQELKTSVEEFDEQSKAHRPTDMLSGVDTDDDIVI